MAKPLDIPDVLTLPALQAHMRLQCAHFGWDTHNDERAFMLFVEEVGELAKAMRRTLNVQIEQNNPAKPILDAAAIKANLSEELADVLNYLIELANRFDIDLDRAYRDSFESHQQRSWSTAK